ncbi:MAG: TlpA family protein disulfide reductase [Planctomycetes bacterium]|nr:TlpA family protein disulfide reductase [Planctomycetota bacterium]
MAVSLLLALLAGAPALPPEFQDPSPRLGRWRAWLDCPGGDLPFGLELGRDGDHLTGWWINGPERILIPAVELDHGELSLSMPHYDSVVSAKLSSAGDRLDGEWRKRRSASEWTRMPFHAAAGPAPRFPPAAAEPAPGLPGRWAVRFESSADPAVAVFRPAIEPSAGPGVNLVGTFQTTLGDYRYLAGRWDPPLLRLSCFDGAHAFLFTAERDPFGGLSGDFWSRESWHEGWTAEADPAATLDDGFGAAAWDPEVDLGELRYHGLDGGLRSLDDPAWAGQPRVLIVFGSWCPNCNDEARLMAELDRRYRDRGLRIVGLGFELTGERERDLGQLRRFRDRHGIGYPLLLAGTADKGAAAAAFPALKRIKAYPTAVFLDRDGAVRAIHTGFAGPATGEEHQRLRERYVELIEELLLAE